MIRAGATAMLLALRNGPLVVVAKGDDSAFSSGPFHPSLA